MNWQGAEPGSKCTLRIDWGSGEVPVEGDILRSRGGSCYLIEEAHESARTRGRWVFRCVRLGKDAARDGDPGVFGIYWHSRG